MKKNFTLLFIALLSTAFGQIQSKQAEFVGLEQATAEEMQQQPASRSNAVHTLSQTFDEVYVSSVTASLCSNYNYNGYFRLFNLDDHGITESFTITNLNGAGIIWPQGYADGYVYKYSGEITPTISNSDTGWEPTGFYGNVANGTATRHWGNFSMENLEDPTIIEPGETFAPHIVHPNYLTGTADRTGSFWPLYTENGESAPAYFGGPEAGCHGGTAGTGMTYASFGDPKSILLTVTGTTEGLGTVELGSSKLAVYPNPATTEVNIALEGAKIAQVDVADVTGRVVSSQAVKNGKVNVSNLSSGVYFLRVKDDKGVTRIQKFIKK
jgi:hypothetical protein